MAVRVGFAKEQMAADSGFGIGSGNIRVINAVAVVHQNPESKKTGEQEEVRTKVKFTVERLDANWKETGEEIEEMIAVAGRGGLAKFHPGQSDGEDGEIEDLGDDLGIEGNNVIAVNETDQIHPKSKFGQFCVSLQDCGMKPEKLNGYLPNFIGLECHVSTKKEKGEEGSGIGEYGVLIVDKINALSGSKKGAAKPVAGKAAALKAGTKPINGTTPMADKSEGTKSASAPEPSDVDAELDGYGTATLLAIAAKKAGVTLSRTNDGPAANRLHTQVSFSLKDAGVEPKSFPAVQKLIKNDSWLEAKCEEMGWACDSAGVTFPDA